MEKSGGDGLFFYYIVSLEDSKQSKKMTFLSGYVKIKLTNSHETLLKGVISIMYKAEFEFNTNVDADALEKVYAKTDEIFAQEDLACCDKTPGRRVYQDKGRKQDYGRFWAAFFALKDMEDILDLLKNCFWYNGKQKENLLTGFLRN